MPDTEIRRTLRVLHTALEAVRENYPTHPPTHPPTTSPATARTNASTASNVAATRLNDELERAGTALWLAHGLLVQENVDRSRRRLLRLARQLNVSATTLRRQRHRDLSDALTDASQTITALTRITELTVAAGLAD
jgi:hypothetical protein